ncbi:hypothetical protein [Vibrio agarilyticus]|uniref:hypothetical protein n=1 Tax=Vibrio agarilyticus TaxID=2726741 RepID=UPI001FE60E9F|nr:hypothetical protein [Vibrio agarilyticus]
MNNNKNQKKGGSSSELMAISTFNRIAFLRKLSKSEELQFIDDVNQALEMNREQDISEVVAMIKDNVVAPTKTDSLTRHFKSSVLSR